MSALERFDALMGLMVSAGILRPDCSFEEFEAALEGAAGELGDTDALLASAEVAGRRT